MVFQEKPWFEVFAPKEGIEWAQSKVPQVLQKVDALNVSEL